MTRRFHKLLFRRDWPYFYAFDLLAMDGEDLRGWPLVERKRLLSMICTAAVPCCFGRRAGVISRASSENGETGGTKTDGVRTSWVRSRILIIRT